MTDLAQKIADGLRKSGLVSEMDMGAVLDAIRTALPVAQGEAVALHREAVRVAAVAAIRAATKCPDLIGYDGKALSEGLMDALDGIFYEGPASRIAELEREVEYLRAAMRRAEVHLESYNSAFALDTLQIALAAQEKNDE